MNSRNSSNLVTKKRIDEFMLAEFALLESVREHLTREGESRGSFFLATVSGSLIAIGLLNQSNLSHESITLTVLLFLFFWLFLVF